MPSVLQVEYKNSITYILDYVIENSAFEPWKNRLIDQILKNTEVSGFRKGKAPRDLALSQVNPQRLEETILRETLEKFGNEAIQEITTRLERDKRIILTLDVSVEPEFTGEKDGQFFIRLIAKLLPQVDISALEKIKIDESAVVANLNRPKESEFIEVEKRRFLKTYNNYHNVDRPAQLGDLVLCNLNGTVDGESEARLSSQDTEIVLGSGEFLSDFENQIPGIKKDETKTITVNFPDTYFEPSVAGKKAKFDVTCIAIRSPEYTKLEEIFENNAEAKEQFANLESFEEFLRSFYQNETIKLIEEARQRMIIKESVKHIPDFELPEDRVAQETSRIFTAIKSDSENSSISLSEALVRSGIPTDNAETENDEIKINQIINDYVRKEFKLSSILHFLYENQVKEKITNKQLDQAVAEIKKNPKQFNVADTATDSGIRDFALDRLKRQSGAQYLFSLFRLDNGNTESTKPSEIEGKIVNKTEEKQKPEEKKKGKKSIKK